MAGRTTSVNTIANVQAKPSGGSANDIFIFVTQSAISDMNLGGLTGPDSQCAAAGAIGSVSSTLGVTTWRALVASNTQTARNRMSLAVNVAFFTAAKTVTGVTLATTEAQLWNDASATLNQAPNIDENGNTFSGSVAVGSTANNCNEWSSNSGAVNFVAALSSATTSDWWFKLAPTCSGGAHLYCYGVAGQ